MRVQEDQRGEDEPLLSDETNESGQAATGAEALVERRFVPADRDEALRKLTREAPSRLPRRRSYRRTRGRRGPLVDLRRTLRDAARNDGEVLKLSRLKRSKRPRKILLLIDVSGSMKARTEDNLRLAHALTQACPRIEIFTFGTRLTRVTRPLHLKQREQALAAAAHLVSDWDGGTRIGDALQAFLAVPRFAGYARGAAVLIVSDGLERGDPFAMSDAVAKLSRRAWRLSWLTPLAVGKNFKPQTEALVAIARFVDDMVDGGSTRGDRGACAGAGAWESGMRQVAAFASIGSALPPPCGEGWGGGGRKCSARGYPHPRPLPAKGEGSRGAAPSSPTDIKGECPHQIKGGLHGLGNQDSRLRRHRAGIQLPGARP